MRRSIEWLTWFVCVASLDKDGYDRSLCVRNATATLVSLLCSICRMMHGGIGASPYMRLPLSKLARALKRASLELGLQSWKNI